MIVTLAGWPGRAGRREHASAAVASGVEVGAVVGLGVAVAPLQAATSRPTTARTDRRCRMLSLL